MSITTEVPQHRVNGLGRDTETWEVSMRSKSIDRRGIITKLRLYDEAVERLSLPTSDTGERNTPLLLTT